MIGVYERGPGDRHKDLESKHRSIHEGYQKSKSRLQAQLMGIHQRSDNVTRLRDGRSTVTNLEEAVQGLEQSTIAVKQGNNIRVLTYITIAYLPLGWVTGLFSINHDVVPDNVGRATFIWLLVIFVVVTFSLALSLENIITAWEKLQDKFNGPTSNSTKDSRKNNESAPKTPESAIIRDKEPWKVKAKATALFGKVKIRRRKERQVLPTIQGDVERDSANRGSEKVIEKFQQKWR